MTENWQQREDEFKSRVRELVKDGFPDDVLGPLQKDIDDAVTRFSEYAEGWLRAEMATSLSAFVQEMTRRVIDNMLAGNENEVRRYLKCDPHYTGRDRKHPVIHGELFEQGGIKLRKQLCEAYPDLLKTERILDLEDQVRSLVEQNNKLEQEKEGLIQRLRSAGE